ncbi:WXG100 family type VII secretion target [Nocardia noduli]|uniref:WXG100 family type VII secretion target n=1 Tax=Nocardia noduli TaxID=2815722 RepID=UPI001C21702D|nr:WXG100 family type VII secretion target [Nocardia noduli]
MSGEFTFDSNEIEQLVARLSGLAGFIAERLEEIDRRVAGIAESGWNSVAAAAYQEAHQRWASDAREFATGIYEMSDAAKAAHESYTRATEANLKMTGG